jgi:hypothetical protein
MSFASPTFLSQIPSNIFTAANGLYGQHRVGGFDSAFGPLNTKPVFSGANVEIKDKCIVVKNEDGHNKVYNKETGQWSTFLN